MGQRVRLGAIERANAPKQDLTGTDEAAADEIGDRLGRERGTCHQPQGRRGGVAAPAAGADCALSRSITFGVRSSDLSAATTVLY